MLGFVKRLFGRGGGIADISCMVDESDHMYNPLDNPSFALALQKRVEATKAIGVGLFKEVNGEYKEVNDKILSPLLLNVNTSTSWGDMIEAITVWSLSSANGCLIEKRTAIRGFKPSLVVYSPDSFTVYMSAGEISRIDILGQGRFISGDELKNFLWLKKIDYYAEALGASRDNEIATGSTIQRSLSIIAGYVKLFWKWNFTLTRNSGRPSMLISTGDGYIDKDQAREITDTFTAGMNNHNNGKVIVMEGNLKAVELNKTPTDVDWKNGERLAHERMCLSLGVPIELVGAGESTYNNRKHALRELYTDTIIPWYKDLINKLNLFLEVELKGLRIGLKLSEIEALREDKESLLKALETAKDRLTVNEYRREYAKITGAKLSDVKGGDEILIGNEPLSSVLDSIIAEGEGEDDI